MHGAGKEYGKADSRYVTRDSFVINMEAVTAFVVGPMCFWAVAAMVHRKSWRHVLQLIISICQLYGDVLYFRHYRHRRCASGCLQACKHWWTKEVHQDAKPSGCLPWSTASSGGMCYS